VKKLPTHTFSYFQHNHNICQGICLARVRGFVFRCHRTPPPVHTTTQWLRFSPLPSSWNFRPARCFFKCKNKWKSLGARSGLWAGLSEVISLPLPPVLYLYFLDNPRICVSRMLGQTSRVSSSHKNKKSSYKHLSGNERCLSLIERLHSTTTTITT
jgi:hypothetical protein